MSGIAPPPLVPMLATPNVYRVAKPRPQPQRSSVMAAFGVPKAFASRWMKPIESAIAVVDGDDSVKATASGPCCLATRRSAAAAW